MELRSWKIERCEQITAKVPAFRGFWGEYNPTLMSLNKLFRLIHVKNHDN